MKEIVNTTTRALALSGGTILAAAGTDGCCKRVELVSDAELAERRANSKGEPVPAISESDVRRLGDAIVVRDVAQAGAGSRESGAGREDAGRKEKA